MSKHSLINRSRTRRFALEYAKANRYNVYDRVAESWYDKMEAILRDAVRKDIHRQPSVGRTLR